MNELHQVRSPCRLREHIYLQAADSILIPFTAKDMRHVVIPAVAAGAYPHAMQGVRSRFLSGQASPIIGLENRSMSPLDIEITTAIGQPSPTLYFRECVKRLVEAGKDRKTLLSELELLRSKVSPQQEDVILETMDFLVGWCHPDMKI